MSDRRTEIRPPQATMFDPALPDAPVAPVSAVPPPEAPPRDPFARAALPQRPTYLPEEGDGGRSEVWATLKGLALATLAILLLGWLLTSR
ncbi:hypothetical protein [Falsiroseomonas selenitidurans]|uniref:Uncharacterized protein n=1 Tax=Falsiroseomonas selenitidurans TaxID=2716335 RepID=A0ABX1E5J2_9PROT|nr:hypothetical protein [Falsiroseomonas selenitidurans]NKC32450.1 hypothetical protein [Falsiroseomonas selenitidurans]